MGHSANTRIDLRKRTAKVNLWNNMLDISESTTNIVDKKGEQQMTQDRALWRPGVEISQSEHPPLSSTTAWDLLVRWEKIHFKAESEKPKPRCFISNLKREIVSKASLKSHRTSNVMHSSFTVRRTSWHMRSRAVPTPVLRLMGIKYVVDYHEIIEFSVDYSFEVFIYFAKIGNKSGVRQRDRSSMLQEWTWRHACKTKKNDRS